MSALVRVRDLAVTYDSPDGPVHAVRGVSFDVEPGRCVALVGESGSGKSTVARALLGLAGEAARVTATELVVDGADGLGLDERGWRRLRGDRIGLVLQDALQSLDPLRSVAAEVGEALGAHHRLPRRQRRSRVLELLADAGIPDPERRARQHAHELSGGLRQRALIATGVAGDPRVLVADEPTTALDVSVQRQVLDLLGRLTAEGLGLVLVSHDLAVVAEVADHVLVLRDGEVVEEGDPRRILRTPQHPYTQALVAALPTAGPVEREDERPASEPPVLAADQLDVRYRLPGRRELVALTDVSVAVRRGRTLGVVGESGSGKSTLLRVLLALQEPDRGRVTLDGAPWSGIPERDRRERRPRVQIVAQDPLGAFDPRWDVRRLLTEALVGDRARLSGAERDRVLAGALDDVGLGVELIGRSPLDLSGGQRQRVAIARALLAQPDVLLCDEAVSALDVLVQAQVLDLLGRLRREHDLAIVFVSHDLAVVRQVSDDVVVLCEGRVVERGPVAQVWQQPQHPYTRRLLADLPTALAAEQA
ncbi:MAG TPA: ABC transporter ATP-binding protein [Cellulomonas sp.]